MDAFVNYVLEKVKNADFGGDRDAVVFKITMEIHACHEKLKKGLRAEDTKSGAHLLLDYYRELSGSSAPLMKKIDTTFIDVWDIVRVYSVQLDETFPLIEYPYRLFLFNSTKIDEDENIKKIKNLGKPLKTKDFVKIYKHLAFLPPDTQKQLMIHSFFADS